MPYFPDNKEWFICLAATNALANSGSAQAIFDETGAGAFTLPVGSYFFEMFVTISGMSTGASNNAGFDIRGAGTATIGSWNWWWNGLDVLASATAANMSGGYSAGTGTPANALLGTTSAGMGIRAYGTFRVTTAGTLIPSVTLVTAIGTAVVAIGSHFRLRLIGSDTVRSLGPVS